MSGFMGRAKSTLKAAVVGAKTLENRISKKTFVIAITAFVMTALSVGALSFNVSYALAVNYKGETIGYVSSESVYTKAIESISNRCDDRAKKNLRDVEIEEKVASVDSVMDAKDLESTIIENVEGVEERYGLYKNGELFAVLQSSDQIENAKSSYMASKSNGLEEIGFVDDFKIKKGYFNIESVITESELVEQFESSNTKVCGYVVETKKEKIKFTTETQKSNKYPKDEKVVTREGENGKRESVVKVFYENGKKVREEVISTKVLKAPVSEKVTIGTGSVFTLDFPLKDSYTLTSDYGEWRGGYSHQGMDIASAYGNPIYASAAGTVVEAQYSSYGWGINVLIDHGNGVKTRYAHCSSLDVSVGQKVARGEKIAEIGMTGDASCNHVHYEVYSGGIRVNPHNYLAN